MKTGSLLLLGAAGVAGYYIYEAISKADESDIPGVRTLQAMRCPRGEAPIYDPETGKQTRCQKVTVRDPVTGEIREWKDATGPEWWKEMMWLASPVTAPFYLWGQGKRIVDWWPW